MESEKDLKSKTMEELVNLLVLNEAAQYKIYDDYKRAADMDLTMRELKKGENLIRRFIAYKCGAEIQ